MNESSAPTAAHAALRRRACLAAVVFYAALLPLVLRVRVEYWDGFDYLLNAKCLAGASSDYVVFRSPLLPLIMLPVQFIGRVSGDWHRTLVYCHAAALAISAGFVYVGVVFAAPRTRVGAVLAGALLGGNLITLDYGLYVMADLLAAALFTLAWLSWEEWLALRTRRAWTRFLLWNGLGLLSKQTFPLLWPAFLLSWLLRRPARSLTAEQSHGRRERAAQWALMMVVSGAMTFAVAFWGLTSSEKVTVTLRPEAPPIARGVAWITRLTVSADYFVQKYRANFSQNVERQRSSRWLYLHGYAVIFGPVFLVALAAALFTLRGTDPVAPGRAVSLLWSLGAFSLLISHKEVRYLAFLVPTLAYYAVQLVERWPPRLAVAAMFVALIVPLGRGIASWREQWITPAFHHSPLHGLTVKDLGDNGYVFIPPRPEIPDEYYRHLAVCGGGVSYLEEELAE